MLENEYELSLKAFHILWVIYDTIVNTMKAYPLYFNLKIKMLYHIFISFYERLFMKTSLLAPH